MTDILAKRKPPNRMTIFRATDAPSLDESQAMRGEYSAAVLAGATKLHEAGLHDGHSERVLFQSTDGDGVSLVYAWFKQNFPLPAHSHDSDCLYYVISGSLTLGRGVASEVLHAGDGMFLRAGTVYSYSAGPDGLEILEFRGVSHFDIQVRDANPAAWEAMAAIVTANRGQWMQTKMPPPRHVVTVDKSG